MTEHQQRPGESHRGVASAPGQTPRRGEDTQSDALLTVVRNLAEYHREHEKYYSEVPLCRRHLTTAGCAHAYGLGGALEHIDSS